MSNYNAYLGTPAFEHGEIPKVGVLLANLGTPGAPTDKALRPYLREFLGDPRVIELPKFLWSLILNLTILPRRPKVSAKLYASVWTEDGSPLLAIARRQTAAIEATLGRAVATPTEVTLAMRYGEPSMARGLAELRDKGCRRILVLPLYPQYSATTVASTFDALAAELTRWRWVPDLRTIHSYHDEPGYIAALASSIREVWEVKGEAEKLLFSFHGIPQRYFDNGDPYHCLCHKTARLVAAELGIDRERYVVAFQSIFGKEEWIKPTTDVTVRALAASGLESLDMICPGFSADCLETLEEINGLNREFWTEAGGPENGYRYIPCLNDRPDHLAFLADLLLRNLQGWVELTGERDEARIKAQAELSKKLADEMNERAPIPADAGVGRS